MSELEGQALGVLRGEADQNTGTSAFSSFAAEPIRITLALNSELLWYAADGSCLCSMERTCLKLI